MSDLSSVINFDRSLKPRRSEQYDMLETLLIELWRAIDITGKIQSEAEDVDGSGFLRSVARAELNLVEAISELMHAKVITVHCLHRPVSCSNFESRGKTPVAQI
jgi:hypothetical protein